jgi:hypothetical protein
LSAWNLWDGTHPSAASTLRADIGTHDTVIWRVHACGKPARIGAIAMIVSPSHHDIDSCSVAWKRQARSATAWALQRQRPEQQATKRCPADLRAQSADADMIIAELKDR